MSQLSQDSLDNLIPPTDLSAPTTPAMSHATLPDSTVAAATKTQAQRIDMARGNMTPPPSTQVPSSQHGKTRTPTPSISQISTPPPTDQLPGASQTGRVGATFAGDVKVEELDAKSPEELKAMVLELQSAVNEAKTASTTYRLQYNMLARESSDAIERMALEQYMADEEDRVANAARARETATPVLPQQEGFIPVEKAQYRKLIQDNQALQHAVSVLEAQHREDDKTNMGLLEEIESLQDRITLMTERIRQSREQLQKYRRPQLSSRMDATPRSVYSTPQRGHAPLRQQQSSQPFAALLQASEMASQESARSAPVAKKGHTRNVHSTSSLPSTPQRAQKLYQQPAYQTPHGRHTNVKVPSTAPVPRTSAIRTPDVYSQSSLPVSQRHGPQSDGTVSASEHGDDDSEAETDIIEQDDEIPESFASRSASQMLRTSQDQQSKRSSFEGRGMLDPPTRGGLKQTKLFGAVTKSNVVRAGYDDEQPPSKRARTEGGIGLGISGTRQ